MRYRINKSTFTFCIFIPLLIFLGFPKIIYSQNAKPVENEQNKTNESIIRVDTNLVTVPASVFDRDGRYVTNLKDQDFQIFEDGIEQQIQLFEPVEQPLTVLLLLDVSGSMSYHLAELTNASNVFVSQLRPNDQLTLATFDEQVHLLFSSKSVQKVRENKKIRLRINGQATYTMVYDAVEFAVKKMRKVPGRKSIILLSDGWGKGYRGSAESNFRDAGENEAPIYTIKFGSRFYVRSNHESERVFRKKLEEFEFSKTYMRNLAQISGGRSYEIEMIDDLAKTFGMIAQELRQQYYLGYYPKKMGKDGERRQIKVRVKIPNAVVRARGEYIYKSPEK